MTERGHDALLGSAVDSAVGSAEGTASHDTTVASWSKRFGSIVMPPAPTPQDGARPPALIVKLLGVAYRPTPGITSSAMRRRSRARPEVASRLNQSRVVCRES
jgi:hypothetical protein